jgi:hypothetical protein
MIIFLYRIIFAVSVTTANDFRGNLAVQFLTIADRQLPPLAQASEPVGEPLLLEADGKSPDKRHPKYRGINAMRRYLREAYIKVRRSGLPH